MHYFITIRTYGTWLHGDERGSVDRNHNQIGEPVIGPNAGLKAYRRRLMKGLPVVLDANCRDCVERTLYEVAVHRAWTIHSMNVLSNHVHIVVETDESPDHAAPDKVMTSFKAWATRRLRESGLLLEAASVWEHHGSARYLKSEQALGKACHYVLNCQDDDHGINTASEPRA